METPMEVQDQKDQDIYSRLGKLERQNWWLKIFGVLLIFISLIPLLIIYFFIHLPQVKPLSQIVKAEKFIVVDNKGKTKAVLGNIINELRESFIHEDKNESSITIEGLLIFGHDNKPRLCLAFGEDLSSDKKQEGHFLVFSDANLKKKNRNY